MKAECHEKQVEQRMARALETENRSWGLRACRGKFQIGKGEVIAKGEMMLDRDTNKKKSTKINTHDSGR